jgi:uncharacterized RDD family membrane protein YckC
MSTQASELSLFSNSTLPTFGGYATESASLEGVTFWPRVAARVIDLIVHYFSTYAAGLLFGTMMVIASGGHVPRAIIIRMRHPGVTGFVFALLGSLAYHVIFTSIHGSTLGKRLLSMVVVQEDGSPCGFKGSLIRELAYFVDAFFFGLIGYTAMQGSAQQQRHGDDWAHTVVCKRSRIAPDNLRGGGRFVVALTFAVLADAAFMMMGLLLIIMG